jgi:hypothetical protein
MNRKRQVSPGTGNHGGGIGAFDRLADTSTMFNAVADRIEQTIYYARLVGGVNNGQLTSFFLYRCFSYFPISHHISIRNKKIAEL